MLEPVVRISTDEEELELHPPGHWATCPRCQGWGTHTNPAIDGNGITASEMAELGDEFLEDYMRGVYNVTCHECRGERLVWEIDWERWYETNPEHATIYERYLDEMAELRSIEEAERRMGA